MTPKLFDAIFTGGSICVYLLQLGLTVLKILDRGRVMIESILSCVAMSVLRMCLLHVVAFSKKLRWFDQTKVTTLKMQLHAVNAC